MGLTALMALIVLMISTFLMGEESRVRASDKDPKALNQMGLAIFMADSTKVDLATQMFAKAATLDYPVAVYNLAVLHDMKGEHLEAAKCFLKAANMLLPQAACRLSLIYRMGYGLPQNDLEAYRWILFGSAYIFDDEREFWLKLKEEIVTRLSQADVKRIQNEVSKLSKKHMTRIDNRNDEILNQNDVTAKAEFLKLVAKNELDYELAKEQAEFNRNMLSAQLMATVKGVVEAGLDRDVNEVATALHTYISNNDKDGAIKSLLSIGVSNNDAEAVYNETIDGNLSIPIIKQRILMNKDSLVKAGIQRLLGEIGFNRSE